MIYPVKKADGLLLCVRDFDKKLDAGADRRVLSCARSVPGRTNGDTKRIQKAVPGISKAPKHTQVSTGGPQTKGKYLPVSAIAVIGRSKSE